MKNAERLSAALEYAGHNWLVLPCKNDKTPLTTHGFKDATTDTGIIESWWKQWPQANVGIATGKDSGLVVLDIDPRNGGEESVKKLGTLPSTPQSFTGGGGQHHYFAYPANGIVIPSRALKGFAGVDIKSDGGYVLAPPSLLAEGKSYHWNTAAHPENIPLADLPLILVNLAMQAKTNPKPNPTKPATGGFGEGTRNESLTKLAGALRRLGAGKETILAALLAENLSRCTPPLVEAEVEKIVESVLHYPPATLGQQLLTLRYTDEGNAEALAMLYPDKLRYVHGMGWHVWKGHYWKLDEKKQVVRYVTKAARARKSAITKHVIPSDTAGEKEKTKLLTSAVTLENRPRYEACLDTASSKSQFALIPDDLDRNPLLLQCPNGTLELDSGLFRDGKQADHITRCTRISYIAGAKAPRWEQFLTEILIDEAGWPDYELIEYIQKALGYCLTGDVRERALFVLYGLGANGKTTFLNVILHILGSYAGNTPFGTLMQQRYGNTGDHDLAGLRGHRFVCASESEQQRWLAESKIKQITGGDPITCRFLRRNFFTFQPSFKLWMASNYKPRIKGTDDAIWDRIKLIPFRARFEKKGKANPGLFKDLIGEAEGILSWMVEGTRLWLKESLIDCPAVREATKGYRKEEDAFARFIEECLEIQMGAFSSSTDLWAAQVKWAQDNGEKEMRNSVSVARELARRGFSRAIQSWGKPRGFDNLSIMNMSP